MSECTIQIVGEGLRIERSLERRVAEKLAIEVLAYGRMGESRDGQRREGLREVLEEVKPKRMVERLVLAGVRVSREKGKKFFAPRELVEELEEVGEKTPTNVARDLAWGVKLGWIAKSKQGKGKYYVTVKGEEVVESGFAEELMEGTAYTKVRKTR